MVPEELQLLGLKAVLAKRQRTRNSHYHDIKIGLFTRGVKIGGRSVAWPAHEVNNLNAARVAGWSSDRIRDLVRRLEDERVELGEAIDVDSHRGAGACRLTRVPQRAAE